MSELLTAVLLLGVAPLWWLAHRLDLTATSRGRWTLVVATLAMIAAARPHAPNIAAVGRLALLFSVAAAVLAWWRPTIPSNLAVRRTLLALLAFVAVANHFYWGDFHGRRTWVHWHELTHYYLGAKYFDELGYGRLYDGMLRAEAEAYDDRLRTLEARDLRTNEPSDVRLLLARSNETKERFTPARWAAFVRDVSALRERLAGDRLWRLVYLDHGFNTTPVWVWLGESVASRVPAGDIEAMAWLTVLDPLLLLLLFAVFWRVFGMETMLFSVIAWAVVFGAGFEWIGGAFLRYGWFVATGLATAALARRHCVLAGSLFALATGLRIFPVVFVAVLVVTMLGTRLRGEAIPRRHLRVLAGFGLTLFLLVGGSVVAHGTGAWKAFAVSSQTYVGTLTPNVVGLGRLVSVRAGDFAAEPELVDLETLRRVRDRRAAVHGWVRWLAAPLLGLALLGASRRRDLRLVSAGVVLLFAGLTLGAYYWVVLVLLIPVIRRNRHALAVLFGGEAVVWLLASGMSGGAALYVFRSLALLWVLAVLEGRRLVSGLIRSVAFVGSRKPAA